VRKAFDLNVHVSTAAILCLLSTDEDYHDSHCSSGEHRDVLDHDTLKTALCLAHMVHCLATCGDSWHLGEIQYTNPRSQESKGSVKFSNKPFSNILVSGSAAASSISWRLSGSMPFVL